LSVQCTTPSSHLSVIPAKAGIHGFSVFEGYIKNGLDQCGRVPVRCGPGPPKLLHRPRTAFPSLLSNRLPRFDREATGKQTMPGSVKQLPPPARIEPERWGWRFEKGHREAFACLSIAQNFLITSVSFPRRRESMPF